MIKLVGLLRADNVTADGLITQGVVDSMAEITHKARLHRRTDCRLCSSPRLETVVRLDPVPLAEKYTTPGEVAGPDELYPIDLHMCLDCGHVQILDVIDSENLWDDYTYHSGQNQVTVKHFQAVARRLVERHRPDPDGLVIDVGSNDGSLLRPFKEMGFRVLGIDPAREIARKATESGIPTIPSLLTADLARRIREEHGPAAVVTAFNVFAHNDDMNGMAESIRIMLADDGIFQFEAQYLLDIVDKFLLGTIFHEHMSHHSLKPLMSFLGRHDMEVIDVERNNMQMGSIIGTAQPKGGPRPVQATVGELLGLETNRRLDQPETVREFAVRLNDLRTRCNALKVEWKRTGAHVAGYGAARSGPTLIVQFGLEKQIEYIFDNHHQKVGRLSPGHLIPVVPADELNKRRPDYVVILAWIHAQKIVSENRAYLEAGGKFVICCPNFLVIDQNTDVATLSFAEPRRD